jgi:hypothetical protein
MNWPVSFLVVPFNFSTTMCYSLRNICMVLEVKRDLECEMGGSFACSDGIHHELGDK